ncbi:MAG: YdcF family protein [Bradymonadia bacterium]
MGQPQRIAIILGCPPGRALARRVDRAVALWREGQVSQVVCTGKGESPWARRRLIASGVPGSVIITEEASTSTWSNLRAVVQMKELAVVGDGVIVLISDPWHLHRALAMARRLRLVAEAAPTAPQLSRQTLSRQLAREGAAWLKAMWRGQVKWSR